MSKEPEIVTESQEIVAATPAAPTPEQQKLDDEAVQFINSTIQETLYKGAIEIGQYLLEKYFDNDPKLASSRNPKKAASFQRLCDHPDLKVDARTLSRMVRVAVQEKTLGANNINLEQIGYTHRISLLKIDDDGRKIELVQKCIAESLSTRAFNELIDEELEDESKGQDEPPKNPVMFVKKIDRFLEDSRKIASLKSGIALNKLAPTKREELKEETEKLLAHMKEITQECNELIKAIGRIPAEPAKETKLKKRKAK